MKFHPRARFFGKSTSAAFNSPADLNLGNSDWYCRYARADAYPVTNPGHYLTHLEFEVDEEVWLAPDDVAQGFDTVVRAAISWIDSQVTGIPEPLTTNVPASYQLHQNYPNPFNPTSTIEFSLPKTGFVTLRIYNILGEEVETLVLEKLNAGKYKYNWDAGALASGLYLYRIQAGDYVESKKMILLR
jgi:hypothetical protein